MYQRGKRTCTNQMQRHKGDLLTVVVNNKALHTRSLHPETGIQFLVQGIEESTDLPTLFRALLESF